MGKGDLKTRKGKIIAGSYGKKRPRNKYAAKKTTESSAAKKS